MKKITAIVAGFGNRGKCYSRHLQNLYPDIKIVAVAEPIDIRRNYAKEMLSLSDDQLYLDWREIAALPKMADFAIIGLQDRDHHAAALALIDKGYDLLLEKPIASTARECKEITEAAEKNGTKVLVCHVLRFTKFYCAIKDILTAGTLGEIISMECKECVGNAHQSHSFVRGNWRKEETSAPMLLAKSCHDMDIIQWLMDKKCTRVQSFGSLTYFKPENKPAGAPDRCTDGCPHADTCPYSAIKLYYDDKKNLWFRGVATLRHDTPTDEDVEKALKEGPYGRCVFACDNNVVDHQVVNMEFEGGSTVSFTMNAFNRGGRFIHIYGTKGELSGQMGTGMLRLYSFETKTYTDIDTKATGTSLVSGHGGGDAGIITDLVEYFANDNRSNSICHIRTSYENHLIAFAAEESRINGTVVDLGEFEANV